MKIILVPFFVISSIILSGQQIDKSLNFEEGLENKYNTFFEKDWVKKATAPTLLFAASAATWNERSQIKNVRDRYIPSFNMKYDDYLQYTPTATVYALKIAGVKGRNNTLRATFSYGTSLVMMGILVNSIKYTAKVERPDKSANNSFPSGHSAMAFTNASFLHKEYGVVNPAYSIAGYSVATFTGVGRYLNNRHWVSDILAGAGIGILSTELGYFFIDKFYKNKGDNMGMLSRIEGNENPSFLALKVGPTVATTNFLKEAELSDYKEAGFEIGFEGAYFFNKNFGIGADVTFSSFPVKPKHFLLEEEQIESFDIYTQSLGFLNFGIGPYYAYHFNDKFLMMLRSSVGYNVKSNGKIIVRDANNQSPDEELVLAEYKPDKGLRWTNGITFTYKINDELGISAYADYNQSRSRIVYDFSPLLGEEITDEDLGFETKDKINYASFGLKLTAFF